MNSNVYNQSNTNSCRVPHINDVGFATVSAQSFSPGFFFPIKLSLFNQQPQALNAIFDPGGSHSFISASLLTKVQKNIVVDPYLVPRRNMIISTPTGVIKSCCSIATVSFQFGKSQTTHEFLISHAVTLHDMVLGHDFCDQPSSSFHDVSLSPDENISTQANRSVSSRVVQQPSQSITLPQATVNETESSAISQVSLQFTIPVPKPLEQAEISTTHLSEHDISASPVENIPHESTGIIASDRQLEKIAAQVPLQSRLCNTVSPVVSTLILPSTSHRHMSFKVQRLQRNRTLFTHKPWANQVRFRPVITVPHSSILPTAKKKRYRLAEHVNRMMKDSTAQAQEKQKRFYVTCSWSRGRSLRSHAEVPSASI